jgi:hypothetical protein
MEHCFSDEYSTTSDDEEDDMKISPQQRSLFTLPKKTPNRDSDDETSDVSRKQDSRSSYKFHAKLFLFLFALHSKKLTDS